MARAARTLSAKRTVARTCSTQYPGSLTRPSTRSPVTLPRMGRTGLHRSRVAQTDANAGSIASIIGEWNAWDTASRVHPRPRSRSVSARARTISSGPERTVCRGAFTAATATSDGRGARSSRTSSSDAATATIAPPGSSCISRPRAATSRAPSSRDSTPATHAATTSPTLWPRTTSGTHPTSSHARAREISSAKSAGCAHAVWSRSTSGDHITSSSDRPSKGSRMCAQASRWRRKPGSTSYRARPIPVVWEPCPVNIHATPGGPAAGRRPRVRSGDGSPAVSALRPVARAARESTASVARHSKCDVRLVRAQATVGRSISGWSSSHRPRSPARSVRAPGSRAETGTTKVSCAFVTPGSFGAGGAHSCSTTCALVPLKPNALTPITCGGCASSNTSGRVITSTGHPGQSTWGVGVVKFVLGSHLRCWSISTPLIKLAMPAAPSR